ncbi:hypothetical protein J2X69_002684 [Algoriphagus sp. 4150]|uniref:hypothetical protein n=1 Tax=Algoriphagus sp. 4150 TaxID=2817756 RepID=UPI0028585079|nr:hypothetical protein [Algoriphagus sp. 4150]MDR7130334.1 hypothetical protein [Algoriphagus sp. 4150]
MKDKDRFLDFPIALLKGFLENHNKCLENIYCYAVFKMVYSEEAVFEDIEEFVESYQHNHYVDWTEHVEVRGEQLYNSFVSVKHVWTGIHINTFMMFFLKDRSEADLVCLLAYLGLKSIVQKDKIKFNISNEYLVSRMAGSDSILADESIPPIIRKHLKNKSKIKTKLFDTLESSYGVVRPSGNTRGIVCSLTLSKKDLELEIMKKKYKKSKEYRKQEDQSAKDQAKQEFEKWKKTQQDTDSETQ